MAASSTPPPEAPVTATDQRSALEKEWGKYVAAEDIYINGVAAFRAGDPVPVSHVERKDDAPVSASQVTEKKG